jgi:hypothetical protein
LKPILSYKDFISGSLKESLDPFIRVDKKFKIGETVNVNGKTGKITSIQGSNYLIMIDSKNQRVKESNIEKLDAPKKHKAKPNSKKLPKTRDINI